MRTTPRPCWPLSALSVAGFFAAWYVITVARLAPANLLPSMGEVWAAFVDVPRNGYRGTTLAENIAATLARCLGGFALATVGVRGVNGQRIQAALACGATQAQVFRHVVLPSCLPTVMTAPSPSMAASSMGRGPTVAWCSSSPPFPRKCRRSCGRSGAAPA